MKEVDTFWEEGEEEDYDIDEIIVRGKVWPYWEEEKKEWQK